MALREWFDAFEIHHNGRIIPVLSAAAVARIVREPGRFPAYEVEIRKDAVRAMTVAEIAELVKTDPGARVFVPKGKIVLPDETPGVLGFVVEEPELSADKSQPA